MKIFARYNSIPESLEKFAEFDRQKYYKMYEDLFHTITDGMNADLENNIREAFKKVGGNVRFTTIRDNYLGFDGWVNKAAHYSCGGSIQLAYLQSDARRLAEDLVMGYFKTTEGKDVQCNTYEFIDWMLGD